MENLLNLLEQKIKSIMGDARTTFPIHDDNQFADRDTPKHGEAQKLPPGVIRYRSGWWKHYVEDERPMFFIHTVQDGKKVGVFLEHRGVVTRLNEDKNNEFVFSGEKKQKTYGYILFEHKYENETIVFSEASPSFLWETTFRNERDTVPVFVREMTHSDPNVGDHVRGVLKKVQDDFLRPFIGERRMFSFYRNNGNYEIRQKIEDGPPLLKLDPKGTVIGGYSTNRKITFEVHPSKFTPEGRWKDSQFSYLAMELVDKENSGRDPSGLTEP